MKNIRRSTLFASLIAFVLLITLFVAPHATQAQSSAKIVIFPAQATQGPGQEVTVQLAGFLANEAVTVWQTNPDYTVQPIGTYSVNTAGIVRFEFEVDGDVPIGLHHFSARGNTSGIMAITGFEVLPPAVDVTQGVMIEVTTPAGANQGSSFTFSGSGYYGKEPVSIWLTLPNGTVQNVGTKRTHQGNWTTSIAFDEKDPIGQYAITGYGNMSDRTGIATFIVTSGDYTMSSGGASLVATPANTRQLQTVELHGEGFAPGEVVSIWITMADGTVWSARKVLATDGTFTEAGYIPALIPDNGFPIGTTTFTAYGHSSKLVATASVELLAGSGF